MYCNVFDCRVELMQIGWLELSGRKRLPAGGIRSADLSRFNNDGEGDVSVFRMLEQIMNVNQIMYYWSVLWYLVCQ